MSLGLEVGGTLRQGGTDPLLGKIENWILTQSSPLLRDVSSQDEDGSPVLLVDLHPAAEALRISVPNERDIRVSAQTSSAGPGYHFYVCDFLRRLGEDLAIDWAPSSDDGGDETGYLDSGDEQVVYREMLLWLSKVCELVLQESQDSRADLAIAMPVETGYTASEFLITPMGPRSRQWAESAARNPENGRDFFAWWHPERDARYHLNRALCLMWTEVRWRKPLVETETRTLNETADCLEQAYRLETRLPYPYQEWQEIAGYVGRPEQVPTVPRDLCRTSSSSLIGYRRNPVRVSLTAGWSIRVPGGFAESWDEDTWCAWDPTITVWITAFSSQRDGAPTPADKILDDLELDSGDVVAHEAGSVAGRGCIRWVEEEQRYWRLRARSATAGRFCLCTICYGKEELREDALEIWRSLRR